MRKRILVTVAGWEERFLKGCEHDILTFNPDHVLVLYSEKYADWTMDNRLSLQELCASRGISVYESLHHFDDQKKNFESLIEVLSQSIGNQDVQVRFNATTAPREIIWSVLHFLDVKGVKFEFSYYRVGSYGDWLSQDADVPRLMMKRSGIMYPDLPTCLLVISGFDDHRLGQLIRKFEPRKVFVGVQVGSQLGNSVRNRPEINDFGIDIECFDFDGFDCSEMSAEILAHRIQPIAESHNIIAASLGPKPSALTLFRLTKIRPSIGLVYIAAKEYNKKYSNGIDLSNVTMVSVD